MFFTPVTKKKVVKHLHLAGHLVMHHVLFQGGSDLEHLATLVTLELLDIGVVELTVLSQVALLAEAQPTIFTNERLLSGMGSHVR